jgi:hypothetical protein
MLDHVRTAWATTIDRQHRLPQGLLGRLVGEKMVRQHQPETDWTVEFWPLHQQVEALAGTLNNWPVLFGSGFPKDGAPLAPGRGVWQAEQDTTRTPAGMRST